VRRIEGENRTILCDFDGSATFAMEFGRMTWFVIDCELKIQSRCGLYGASLVINISESNYEGDIEE
jgi:hypothetical protein